MGLIQAYDRGLTEQPGRWTLPKGMRSLVGGAAVPEALIRAFAKHGVWIIQGWGMTETSPIATISYVRDELKDAGDEERFKRAAMAGVPAPLVDVRIRTEEGRDAPWDGATMGEIQVRGPFITGSYHEVPITADKFTDDGWLRTGDVATMDEFAFVRITDRTKDLIKSGGEWISSVDLENALMAHPAVAEAAVIAIPDEKWSERPLACIVFKPGQAVAADTARRGVRRPPAAPRLRALAGAGPLRGHRCGAAHLDRQVLEAEAARALPALRRLTPERVLSGGSCDRRPRRHGVCSHRAGPRLLGRRRSSRQEAAVPRAPADPTTRPARRGAQRSQSPSCAPPKAAGSTRADAASACR